MWLHTDRGLYRYNGITAEYRGNTNAWARLRSGDSGEHIWCASRSNLLRHYAASILVDTLTLGGTALSGAVVEDTGTTLLIGRGNVLYRYDGDCPADSLVLDEGVEISALLHLGNGDTAVGTGSHGVILLDEDGRIKAARACPSRVRAMYEDSRGNLWTGLLKGGALMMDRSTLEITRSYSSFNSTNLLDVRSFTENNGEMFMATAVGLFRIPPGRPMSEETPSGQSGEPICCVFTDKDGSLWTGTYYHGVFFSDSGAIPLTSINSDSSAALIKGMAEDKNGIVWLLTDGNGLFLFNPATKRCSLVSGTTGIKYQSAWYDSVTNRIWAGEFRGRVLSYDIDTCQEHIYATPASETGEGDGSVCAVLRRGEDLLMGSTSGLYAFNPAKESSISRKLFDSLIYTMNQSKDGGIHFAGLGIYYMDNDGSIRQIDLEEKDSWMRSTPCYDLERDGEGRLWMAFSEEGVVCLDGSTVTRYSTEDIGLSDNYTSNITLCQDGRVLVVSNSGISIINPATQACFNYNKSNGLDFGATIGGKSLVLRDGTILLGGNDGMEMIPGDFPDVRTETMAIVPDKIFVNGKRTDLPVTLPFVERIMLRHDQNNFSIETATFNYTRAQYTSYKYRLKGFNKEWQEFSPYEPISFMNIKPGHYVFEVQASRHGGQQIVAASLPIRIRPAWYATRAARISFISFSALVILVILMSINSRMILSEKLRLREKENQEKTRFFVELSYQLRTPVNLIIGQLEKFFRDFGSRTAGIENIENVYGKAKQMRSMISDYVDSQNDGSLQDTDEETLPAATYENAKFLNSAIGAVERHLYSKDLNVKLLCSELNLGKTTLTARIKEVSGMTPREFIEDIRLKHAAEMLSGGGFRISEIADNLAFGSPKYFSARFKLKYGVNPRDYKK